MDSVVVRRNQSLNSALQQRFDAALLLNTQYTMSLCWSAGESDSWHNFDQTEYGELSFKLYDPEYHLSLTDTIHFDRNDSVPRDNANLYYSIKNTGADFDGEIQVFYYQGPYARGRSEIRPIHVGTGETLADAFSGELEQVPGTYTVILRYRELDGDWQEFIDKNYYNLGMITATVVPASPLELHYTDEICEGENYAGYGFNIEAAQLPAFGNSKDFFRSNPDKYLRDSLITLTLTVTKADTLLIEDEILNNALPYKLGEDIIIPAGASIGLQEPVLRKTDSCAYKMYRITVNRCELFPDTIKVSLCEDETTYEGYGFKLGEGTEYALPACGDTLSYQRHESSVEECDSLITLTLIVIKADTTTIDPITVKKTDLPYIVDAFYTVPEETDVGSFEVVVKNDAFCGYNRYAITVEEVTPDPPTEIENIEYRVQNTDTRKILRNGTLLIIHDGKTYNAQGQLIQ
jgi:hypothetical protein